jgi:hypothetical protein
MENKKSFELAFGLVNYTENELKRQSISISGDYVIFS